MGILLLIFYIMCVVFKSSIKRDVCMLKVLLLFFVIVLVEIIGCFLFYLWLCKGVSMWLLLLVVVSLVLFVWLLILYFVVSGWVYVVYGGVYVVMVLIWLRVVDGVKLFFFDWVGVVVVLVGMLIIVVGWWVS